MSAPLVPRTRLAIATTGGPSVVAAFDFEAQAARSQAVRFDESHIRLGIDTHFHAFDEKLRIALRERGRPVPAAALIAELEGGVDTGDSWHMGLAGAHLLSLVGALALEHDAEPPARAVLATGRLGTRLWDAKPVEGIAEKLTTAGPFFESVPAGERLFVLPAENLVDVGTIPEGVRVVPVDDLAGLIGVLLPVPATPARPRRSRLAAMLAGTGALALATGAGVWLAVPDRVGALMGVVVATAQDEDDTGGSRSLSEESGGSESAALDDGDAPPDETVLSEDDTSSDDEASSGGEQTPADEEADGGDAVRGERERGPDPEPDPEQDLGPDPVLATDLAEASAPEVYLVTYAGEFGCEGARIAEAFRRGGFDRRIVEGDMLADRFDRPLCGVEIVPAAGSSASLDVVLDPQRPGLAEIRRLPRGRLLVEFNQASRLPPTVLRIRVVSPDEDAPRVLRTLQINY